MITVPFQINEREYSIFVVLENDNIERIRQYDPAQIAIAKMPQFKDRGLMLKDMLIGYATQAEIDDLAKCQTGAEVQKMLQRLSRGFAFRPDKGDSDQPYESIRGKWRNAPE